MMVKFNASDVPVAYSLIKTAEEEQNPFTRYFYFWAAFNDIYSTISYIDNKSNKIKLDKINNLPILQPHCNVSIPLIKRGLSETGQIHLALDEFNFGLKDWLISHNNIKFFLNRIPRWKGKEVEHGYQGYKLNGVIKVNDTSSIEYPVWSPIDIIAYKTYMLNRRDSVLQVSLAKQIVELLYTVRCNLAHGDKDPDDANDDEVIKNALPLLKEIVLAFTDKNHF